MYKANYRIEVDFEVYRELFSRRESEEVSFNEVLRNLLNLSPIKKDAQSAQKERNSISKIGGIDFPDGTLLKRKYKNIEYTAEIKNGAIVYKGKKFDSPSGAAMEITFSNVNGWRFWECQLPGHEEWMLLDRYRKNLST